MINSFEVIRNLGKASVCARRVFSRSIFVPDVD